MEILSCTLSDGYMFILSVIPTSEYSVVVQEAPRVGGGTVSDILFLDICKEGCLRVASALRYGLRFRDVEGLY